MMAPKCISYRLLRRRMRRNLYYGQHRMNHLSIPINEATQSFFAKNCPFTYLNETFSNRLSRTACVDPSSLIIALIYLERLRDNDLEFFMSSEADDLYLAALVLASKYLHDEDDVDFMFNDEWAHSAGLSKKVINALEIDMLDKLKWELCVTEDEFNTALHDLEQKVVWSELHKRISNAGMTYAEIDVLSVGTVSNFNIIWNEIARPLFALIVCSSIAYTAIVFTLFAAGITLHNHHSLKCDADLLQVHVLNDYAQQMSHVTPLVCIHNGIMLGSTPPEKSLLMLLPIKQAPPIDITMNQHQKNSTLFSNSTSNFGLLMSFFGNDLK